MARAAARADYRRVAITGPRSHGVTVIVPVIEGWMAQK